VGEINEIRTDNLTGKRPGLFNRNILVFAFFLFLSFVFWYLTSLGKDIEAELRYPVRYLNIPSKIIIPGNLPSRVNMVFSGPGYTVLSHKITGNKTPLIIDFGKPSGRPVMKSRTGQYYILTSGLVNDFNSQLKSGCKVTSVKPDTLFLSSGERN
jgi:hypothetical protein